jgi:hypothetical protein
LDVDHGQIDPLAGADHLHGGADISRMGDIGATRNGDAARGTNLASEGSDDEQSHGFSLA